MILDTDRIIASVGDVVFRWEESPTGLGNEFILDPNAMSGWTDGVDVRRSSTARPASDGDFRDRGRRGSRIVTFTGTAIANTAQDLHQMRDKFTGILADGGYGELRVETSVGARYATVGLEGTPSWVQQIDTAATWKIDFYAPDPKIYSEERVVTIGAVSSLGGLTYPLTYPLNYRRSDDTASDKTITNNGNVDSWPIFVVTGDYFSGFTITDNLNNFVTYGGTVTMQAPVTIDMGKGTAIQGGIDKSTLITRRGWFAIPPSETIRPTFTPLQSGNGWCDIIFKDAWI